MKSLLLPTALAPHPGTPEELAALMRKDHERFGKLIRQLNIRAE